MLTEGYIDFLFAAWLNVLAMKLTYEDGENFQAWFATKSDILNSVTTFICLIAVVILPIYIKYVLNKYDGKLEDQDVLEHYGMFYGGYKNKKYA